MRWVAVASVSTLAITLAIGEAPAEACGASMPPPPTALPRSGATNVSTATSFTVLSRQQPAGLTLTAGGQIVPLSAASPLGGGFDNPGAATQFWQVRAATADAMLLPGVEHVLSQTVGGASVELTRFVTAAGYDKVPGTAPVIRGLRLWRVRYPVADISSGNCVFAEYHGFITVDYDPATIPNTPPASVVHRFRLVPEHGGSEQALLWTGDGKFTGNEPSGAYPAPVWTWHPELDPTRAYCLSISAFGEGDIARLQLDSGPPVCVSVTQLSAAGAPPPPQISGGAGASGGGGAGGGGAAGSGAGGGDGGGGGSGGGGSIAGDAGGPAGACLLLVVWLAARARRFRERRRGP